MKKLYLVIALIGVTVFSYGQTVNFGIKAGLNLSNIYTNSYYSSGPSLLLPGFNAGGFVDFGFSTFSIQPGLFYSSKGDKHSFIVPDGGGIIGPDYGTERLNYIELPVNFLYKIAKSKDLTIHAGGGPYVGYGVSVSFTLDGKTTSGSFDSAENNPDFGINFIAGAVYKNKYVFDAGYGLGLGNLRGGGGEIQENRVLSFSVGYLLK